MPGVDDVLSGAKSAMNKANNYTKSVEGKVPSRFAPKPATPAPAVAAPKPAAPNLGAELKAKQDNVEQYMANTPKMHKGGIVPGEKGEEVPIIAQAGEKVIPADKVEGRQSEYRKVFVARQQKRSGGGNKPVTESAEKHDSKKAEKSGQPAAKEAGGRVKS